MKKFTRFQINHEILSSYLLFASVILALVISNNRVLLEYYRLFINIPVSINIGDYHLGKPLLKWVNDGLMAMFFFLLGLEMKYQIIEGEFKEKTRLLLPAFAALGGFVVPAALYSLINYDYPPGRMAWAIPVATDTAFVLAIVSFLGNRISSSVKVFLIGLSIIDDVFAILALAIFYTPNLDLIQLYLCLIPLSILALLNYFKVLYAWTYYLAGLLLWLFTVKSGVHGTIAGVVLAFFIPNSITRSSKRVSMVKELETNLHGSVAFFILPLFAFVNCELPLSELSLDDLYSKISIGSFVGLLIGKPLGVYLAIQATIKFKLVKSDEKINNLLYFGLSCLCGIGFTLSLFIGLQAFEPVQYENQMKIGVLLASVISAIVGWFICKVAVKDDI